MGFLSGRALLGVGIAALALGGCRRGGDAAGDGPYARKLAETIPRVEQALGLKFRTPPKLEVRTRAQVREFLLAQFEKSAPAEDLAGEGAAYKALGLIPANMDLRAFLIELLSEQVIGYYDPATKVLYVVEGAPEDRANITITHELVHALQDQHFDLDSIRRIRGDNDRQAAAQAVVEGGATLEHVTMMLGGQGIESRLPGGWNSVRDLIREAQESQPVFSTAPMVIQESLLFPYINGADFVRRFKERHPGVFPLSRLPSSTEQVLHDERFLAAATPDEPTRITLPPVAGGGYQNNLGEFGTRLFIFQHLNDARVAARAAMGWDGDRFVVVRTPQGDAIAWVTVWDTPIDAAEFVTAVQDALVRRWRVTTPPAEGGGVRTIAGGGRVATIAPGEVAGRNVVVFIDAPRGATVTLDRARVRLAD